MGEELPNQVDAWRIGQKIEIIAGPLIGFEGIIYLIERKERLVRVMIDIFTKHSPVEVPFSSLKALDSEN